MAITATIDRFEGDAAVLLVSEGEAVVNVPRSCLPEDAKQGDALYLEVVIATRRP